VIAVLTKLSAVASLPDFETVGPLKIAYARAHKANGGNIRRNQFFGLMQAGLPIWAAGQTKFWRLQPAVAG
jgi:hypothetical protein